MKNKFISRIIVSSVGFGLMLPAGYGMDKGIMNVDEVRVLLSTGKNVQARFEAVNVTQEDPQTAIDTSNVYFQHGVSFAFQNIKEYTNDPYLIGIAKTMGDVFQSGNMYLPNSADLNEGNFNKAVREAYDIILDTYCWENGHTNEVVPSEVAAYMVTRQRLINLKSLWN